MRAKSIILLIIALGCGTVASVGVSQVMLDQQRGAPAEGSLVEIIIAVKEIEANQKIPLDAVKLEKWPQNRLPEGAVTKVEQVDGFFAKQKLFPGEPLLTSKIAQSLSNRGRDIPIGYRIFDLPVDERRGAAGYIQPGDFVDVHGIFPFDGVKESRPVVTRIQIFGVNGSTVREDDNKNNIRATTFQLLVRERQYEALNLASASGELRCALRPMTEASTEEGEADNGEEFVAWLRRKDPSADNTSNGAGPAGYSANPPQAPATIAPVIEEKKRELLIITPDGVTKYQWSGDRGLPTKVEDKPSQAGGPTASAPTSYPFGSSSLFSGYGGYTPTYPSPSGTGFGDPNASKSEDESSADSATPKKPAENKRKQ